VLEKIVGEGVGEEVVIIGEGEAICESEPLQIGQFVTLAQYALLDRS